MSTFNTCTPAPLVENLVSKSNCYYKQRWKTH